jgi:sulfatase modifying factor 1
MQSKIYWILCIDLPQMMKKKITDRITTLSFLFFAAALLLFFGVMIKTSPYRLLRPYIPWIAARQLDSTTYRFSDDRSHLEIKIPAAGTVVQEDFWIDQIPVTIKAYHQCVADGNCNPAHYRNYFLKYYNSPIYQWLPVTFVSWKEALIFCEAQGGRLPTEMQWNLAAGYAQKDLYPWGNSEPSIDKANYDGYYQGLTPAGWLPNGASRFGVLDLGGNVREWTLDFLIRETYIDIRIPEKIYQDAILSDVADRILKGGSSSDFPQTMEVRNHLWHGQNSPGFNRGFRCVYPIN